MTDELMREAVRNAGVPEDVVGPIAHFLSETFEHNGEGEGADLAKEIVKSPMTGDDYYDLLEGFNIGHRRLKKWISEKRAGANVSLTSEGRRVALTVINATCWKDVFLTQGAAKPSPEGPSDAAE